MFLPSKQITSNFQTCETSLNEKKSTSLPFPSFSYKTISSEKEEKYIIHCVKIVEGKFPKNSYRSHEVYEVKRC